MRKIYLLLLASSVASSVLAQNPTFNLKQIVDANYNVSKFSNVSVSIIDESGHAYSYARGINSIEHNDTLQPTHLLGIGSITKTYTATLILLLQQENKLSINDSLYRYLPTFQYIDSTITLKQLLNHTSGIYDYLNEPTSTAVDSIFAYPSRIWTANEVITNFVKAPTSAPGEIWAYSNTNYLLLQLIIESVTGNPYQVELRNRILIPQHLEHTYFYPLELPITDSIAHAWMDVDADGIYDDLNAAYSIKSLFSMAGAAGAILATTEDLARFMHNLLNGEIINSNSLAMMKEVVNKTDNYGLGLFKVEYPATCEMSGWGHNGGIVYQSIGFNFDGYNFTIAIQTSIQNETSNSLSAKIFNQIIASYCSQTSVQQHVLADEISVYPTPCSSTLNIDISGTSSPISKITLFDMSGRTVFISNSLHTENLTIDMTKHKKGVYILQIIEINGNIGSRKVIRE